MAKKYETEWELGVVRTRFYLIHKATGKRVAVADSEKGGVRMQLLDGPKYVFHKRNRLLCQRLFENNIKHWFPEGI